MTIYKLYQLLPLQDPPKFTQSGIFGLKIYTSGNPAFLGGSLRRGRFFFDRAVKISGFLGPKGGSVGKHSLPWISVARNVSDERPKLKKITQY
jgi:hypothetical protein